MLSRGFSASDIAAMKKYGKAPLVDPSQRVGALKSYQLHHNVPINKGGSVYSIDNITIVTPRYHQGVLAGGYHYGK